jgi:hypothetical protein
MKKFILISFLIFGFIGQVFAQDNDKMFSLGVRGTINGSWIGELPTSTVEVENINRDDLKIGFVGGVWTQFKVLGGFYIQPEVTISQVGGSYSYKFNVDNGGQSPATLFENAKNITLTNLDFPLSLGYRLPLGPIGLNLNIGGIFSTVLSAKETYQQESFNGLVSLGREKAERDIKDKINNFQAALQGGIGLDFSRIMLNFNIQQNLTQVYESQTDTINLSPEELSLQADRQKQRLLSAQVSIGVRLY